MRYLWRQPGQNMVELALLMGFLLTILIGLIDFGRVFYAQAGITNAAREGARSATLVSDPCGAGLATVKARTRAEQPFLGITDAMITVDCSQPDRRTVHIQNYTIALYSFWLAPWVADANGNVVLRTWAAMPVMLL